MYIETAKDGRRLSNPARNRARKPVVMLKGGRTQQGQMAACLAHGIARGRRSRVGRTCASDRLHARRHARPVHRHAAHLSDDTAAAPRIRRARVALFGNGGGTSVLATDYFARLGIDVTPFEKRNDRPRSRSSNSRPARASPIPSIVRSERCSRTTAASPRKSSTSSTNREARRTRDAPESVGVRRTHEARGARQSRRRLRCASRSTTPGRRTFSSSCVRTANRSWKHASARSGPRRCLWACRCSTRCRMQGRRLRRFSSTSVS